MLLGDVSACSYILVDRVRNMLWNVAIISGNGKMFRRLKDLLSCESVEESRVVCLYQYKKFRCLKDGTNLREPDLSSFSCSLTDYIWCEALAVCHYLRGDNPQKMGLVPP